MSERKLRGLFVISAKACASDKVRVLGLLPAMPSIVADLFMVYNESTYERHLMGLRSPKQRWSMQYERARSGFRLLLMTPSLRHYDFVFVNRILPPIWFQNVLSRSAPCLMYDLDDALWTQPPQVDRLNPDQAVKREQRFVAWMRKMKVVFTCNEVLAKKARAAGAQVRLKDSAVDCTQYYPSSEPKNSDQVQIGWVGSRGVSTYLEPWMDALREIHHRYPQVRIRLLGAYPRYHAPDDGIEVEVWSEATEAEFLRSVDIGLMPVSDDEWAKGKCSYKLLLYMASGLPIVGTPLGAGGEYILKTEVGLPATTAQEVVKALDQLINDADLRAHLGQRGREIAVARHDVPVIGRQLECALWEAVRGGI
jgi:glycosyltransferase involved in cell wall biosynthesis